MVGWLGGLLGPPQWVAGPSPFFHVPRVPVESPASWSLPVLVAVAVAAGLAGFQGRDWASASEGLKLRR